MQEKTKIITYSLEEKLKAKEFLESLNDNSKAHIVRHIFTEHLTEFLPYFTEMEVKI